MKNAYRLACSSKVKRAALAKRCAAFAAEHGATFTFQPAPLNERSLECEIQIGDYRIGFAFNGASQVGGFLGRWHGERNARYPTDFGFVCRGSVNEFHYGKATTCVDTFDEFLAALAAGLACLTERGFAAREQRLGA